MAVVLSNRWDHRVARLGAVEAEASDRAALLQAAAKKWRHLKGQNRLPQVVRAIRFRDGVEVTDVTKQHAA